MSVQRGFVGTVVSPEWIHVYRCQSTEGSEVRVSDQKGFIGTDVSS